MAWREVPVLCETCGERIRIAKRRYRRPRLGMWDSMLPETSITRVEWGRHKDVRKCLPRVIEDLQYQLDKLRKAMK
jgi:hypothetical protein